MPEPTFAKATVGRPSSAGPRSTLFVLLLVAALPVFFLALGANSIWDANEAFYVETPRQMVLTGDYVHPCFNALERFNKPVLSYWIVAGLYHAVRRVGRRRTRGASRSARWRSSSRRS